MPINILMPALSPTMTEGTLANWLKKEGDEVKSGDVIAEIETDKATMEVEAVDEGTLGKILVQDGTPGRQGQHADRRAAGRGRERLGARRPAAAKPSAASRKPSPMRRAAPAPDSRHRHQHRAEQRRSGAAHDGQPHLRQPARAPHGGAVRARPSADQGLRPATAASSSPMSKPPSPADRREGRQPAAAAGPDRPRSRPSQAPAAGGAVRQRPRPKAAGVEPGLLDQRSVPHIDGMRKVIARRLTEAKQTVPHFYLTIDLRDRPLLKYAPARR